MANKSAQHLIEDLDELLDRERAVLRKGDVQTVHTLMDRKEDLVSQLNNRQDVSNAALSDLHTKIARNHGLLESALEGVRAVAARMAEMQRVKLALQTYDHTGARHEFEPAPKRTLEKRT